MNLSQIIINIIVHLITSISLTNCTNFELNSNCYFCPSSDEVRMCRRLAHPHFIIFYKISFFPLINYVSYKSPNYYSFFLLPLSLFLLCSNVESSGSSALLLLKSSFSFKCTSCKAQLAPAAIAYVTCCWTSLLLLSCCLFVLKS